MKKIKGAIFDLDGTLLDSMYVWKTLGEEYLKIKGVTPPPDIRLVLKSMSMQEAAEYFSDKFGIDDGESTIIDEINGMVFQQYSYNIPLKPHVMTVLKKLKNDDVKLCIATATDRILVEAALKRLEISDYFEFIMTCSEVGIGKENPKIFCDALLGLNLKKDETVVFEDATHAIKTASNAGFRVFGIYDKTFEKQSEEIKLMTERYLYSWEDFNK